MPSRKRAGVLTDYEIAWVVREVVKLTDKSFSEIAEKVSDYLCDNEDSLSEYEESLGNDIAGEFERLWPRERFWTPGPDAPLTLDIIKRALQEPPQTRSSRGAQE